MAEGALIRVEGLHYTYDAEGQSPIVALRGIGLAVHRGEYLVLLGHNGSGKSTLARCLNGLLRPTAGDVWVQGMNTREESSLVRIRAAVGMVFQNPDNQFISTVAEEEVAFGPENLGVPTDALRVRVEEALAQVGLTAERYRDPRTLSAGQKSRLAIASILAMRPDCLVLDESTVMLDPVARRGILDLVQTLRAEGLTIIAITHNMAEALQADRVVVLEAGAIALQGTPREVFGQVDTLEALGLTLPPAAAIARNLRRRGLPLPEGILTSEELVHAVTHLREAVR